MAILTTISTTMILCSVFSFFLLKFDEVFYSLFYFFSLVIVISLFFFSLLHLFFINLISGWFFCLFYSFREDGSRMKFTLHRIGIYQQRIDQIVEGAIRPAMVSYALNLRGADYYCWFRASMLVMPLPVAHRRLILIGLCCRHCWSHIRHRRIWNSIVSCYFNCLLFETSLSFVKKISRKGMSNLIID